MILKIKVPLNKQAQIMKKSFDSWESWLLIKLYFYSSIFIIIWIVT